MSRILQFAALALLVTPAFAADPCASQEQTVVAPCVAQLANGFSIRHVKREVVGDNVRLYLTEAGYTDLPRAQVARFEFDDTPVEQTKALIKPKSLDDSITEASHRTGVDEDFIRSVIRAESANRVNAVSPKGAQGLMQLMPATAAQLGVKDAFDAHENVRGGSQFLRDLLVRYDGDAVKALAAYNAGPGRVKQYGGVPPYRETRHYVARIIRDYNRRKKAQSNTKLKAKQTQLASRNAAAQAPSSQSTP